MTAPTRPPFKVSGVATIKHLNVRKEGPDDEKILAVDLKLEIKEVDRRLCGYFDEALEAFLWRGDTNALIARNMFLVPVMYLNEISNATCQIGLNHFSGCDVKKFQILPRDGGVMTLTLSLSIYPSSADVSDIAKVVQDEESVTIEGPPDLFDAPQPITKFDSKGDLVNQLAKEFERQGIKVVRNVSINKPHAVAYRGPNGEVWTGRGLMPRWLAVLVKDGQNKEAFRVGA